MSTRHSRVRVLAGASIFAALALLLAALGVTGQAGGAVSAFAAPRFAAATTTTPSAAPTTPQPTPTQKTAVSLVKADKCANPPKHGSGPYIEFCTPSFDGNVEGPWGAHVTLIGGNFNASVVAIYLAAAHGPGVLSQVGCVLPNANCLDFDNGSDIKSLLNQPLSKDFTLSFTWTFPAASAAAGGDYTLIAEVAGDKTVASSASFTLLSTTGPCVSVVANGTPPDCSTASGPAKPLQLLEGQAIQVAGSGWLPGDKAQKIELSLQCQSACQGAPVRVGQLTTSGADQPTTGGALAAAAVTLPAGVTGTYLLIAANADKSEVFGEVGSQAITVNIVAHPCIQIAATCAWSGSETPQSLAKAKSATIMLQYWKPGSKVNVYVVLGPQTTQGCKPTAALSKPQSLASSNDAVGQTLTLPSSVQVGKTYTICASGQSAIGGDTVTAALQVRITKAVAYPLFSLLSLLALLLGLVSAAALVLTTRQRATVPQPVVRR